MAGASQEDGGSPPSGRYVRSCRTMPEITVDQDPSRADDSLYSSPVIEKNKSDSILDLFLLLSPLYSVAIAVS